MNVGHLPEGMNDVTPTWLQQAVKDHPAFRGTRITGAKGRRIGEGIGQMSEITRYELAYDGQQGPASVVVKLHTPFKAMLDVGVRYEMFARETAFYQTLAAEVTVPVPAMYFAAWDPTLQRNAMVMQDMSAWHWPDQVVGATQMQAQCCIDALAKLGARHWGADFSAQPWLPDANSPVIQQVVSDYQLSVPHALERFRDIVSPEARTACERIAKNIDWICDQMAKPPLILTHFDPRLENFVFADAQADKLALIDWQLMARARPGWDIAYFLGTSMQAEHRRLWQTDLIARYLDGLSAGGVHDYTASRLGYDFRLNTMAMTIISVIGGASFDISNNRSRSLFGAMLGRSMASVLDNNCLVLLPN